MEYLQELQNWYKNQCDNDWEHEYGVRIYTVDNPGWCVEIDLVDTPWEDISLSYELFENSEDDWYGYSVENSIFKAVGDSSKLEIIIKLFLNIIK